MLKNLQVISEEETTYTLYGGGSDVYTVFLDGAGLPPVTRILEKAPLQHGATDRGFRLDPRRMTLQLFLKGWSEAQTDAARDLISHIFLPTNSPLILKVTRDDNVVRQIDCFLDGTLDFPMSQRIGAGQPISIPLVAPDPTWYESTVTVSSGDLSGGSVNINTVVTGMTWDAWPFIDITGPATDLELTHTPGGEVITFVAAIPAGEIFRIDTRPGFKTVRRTSDNANRMSFVDPDTLLSFATLRILGQKAMKAVDGSWANPYNQWAFTATGTTGATVVNIRWNRRWLSL